VHPAFHPAAFRDEKGDKAAMYWNETTKVLAPQATGTRVERQTPQSRLRRGARNPVRHMRRTASKA